MRFIIALLLSTSVLLVGGCAPSETAATAVNAHCPIMGHEVADDGGSTTWNGQTIAFCCEGCLPEWNELSDEDKANKLAAAAEKSHDHGEHQGHDPHGQEG